MKFPVKELLIALYLLADHRAIGERLESLGLALPLLIYLGLFGLLTFCLWLAAAVRNRWIRWAYALLFAGAAFFLHSFELIAGEHLTYDVFISLVHSAGFADDAVEQHLAIMLQAAGMSLLLLAGIAIKPPRARSFAHPAAAAAPLVGIAILASILFARGGDGARGLPGAFTPLAYAAILSHEASSAGTGPRQDVALPAPQPKPLRDIVLIVDESVAGNYLDLISPSGVRSGLKEARPRVAIHNFGAAAAVTNCSIGSNLTLRYGGTREDYLRINATMPSIWRYARKAGLRTVYIDAQRTGGALQNMMDRKELRDVDRFIQFDDVPVRDRDMVAADALASLLGDRTADFVIVNKVGAHFPVHDKYPDAFARYQPALPRGRYGEVADTGSRSGFDGGPEDWRRYRNAYRNTLLWNVGAFFDRLFARADLERATLIYTSDHGQDLHERGGAGVATHCASEPVPEEGLVPLVVIEGAPATLDWRRGVAAGRDQASHYAIFPTLLALMGYPEAKVRSLYGASLVGAPAPALSFNTRFNARLGRKPVWKTIDPARIVPPPPQDFANR
ncbi:sulfatase-like hydrolase/transferase [Sphingomonas sp.]|uniref:sulfatase-like hydrolase/transferase n=1 Tax=Sphingomonas sp. TaxID=28214 RepID=UPI002FC6AE9B